jgi:hypothetical protein
MLPKLEIRKFIATGVDLRRHEVSIMLDQISSGIMIVSVMIENGRSSTNRRGAGKGVSPIALKSNRVAG